MYTNVQPLPSGSLRDFAKKINYKGYSPTPSYYTSSTDNNNKGDENNNYLVENFWQIANQLHHAATKYREKYKKPMILIIDNIDILVDCTRSGNNTNNNKDLLQAFQTFAESTAEDGILFVLSL